MAQAAAALVAAANAPRHSFIPNVPVVNPPPLSEEEFYRRQRKERRAANPAERRSTSPSRDRRSPPRDRRSPREGRSPPGDRRSPTRPRSPSKEKDPLAAWNAFINRGNSPKRAKKSSRSPRRSCSPKHSRDNRSPDQSSMKRRKSLSPRRHSRSPRRRLSRSPYRRKSISPGGRYSRSPRRRPSLSPGRRYSPDRRQSPSHSRRPRRSPLGRRAVEPRRSPGRWDSPRSVSRSPYRSPQRSPVHSPVRRTYPSGTSPYRGRVRSPYYDTFDTPPSRERSRRDYHSPHNRSISPRSKFRPLSPRQRSPWRPPIDITDYNRTYYHSQGQSNSPGRHWSPSRRSISPRECQSPPTDRQFVRSPHRKPPSKRALSPHSRSSKLKGGCSPKHKSPGRLSSSKTTAVESPSRARVAVTSTNQSVSGTRLSPTPRNDKPQSLKDTLPAAKTAHDSERSQRSKPLRGTSPRTQSRDSRNGDEKSKESPEDKEASGSVGKSKEVIERSNKTMELGKHSKEPIEKTKENLTAGADTNEKLESRGKVKSKSSKVEGGESSDIKGVSPVNKKDVSSDQKSKKNQAVPEKSTSSANAESRKSRYRDGRDKIRSTSRTAWSDSSSSVSLSPPPQPDSPIKLPPRSHNRQLSPRRFSPHHRQYSSKVDQRRPSPPRTYHRRSSPDQMRSKWYSQTRSKSPSSRNVMNKPPATYEEWWYSMMKQFSGVGPGNSYPEMYNRYMQMYSQQFQARPPPVPLMQLSTSADYRRSDDYSDTRTLDKHVRGRFEQSRDHDYRKDRSKYDYEIDASRRERRKRTRTPSKSSSDEKLAVYEAKKKKKAKKDKKKKDKKKKKSRKMSRDSSPIDTNAPNLEVVVKVSDAQTLDRSDNASDEQPPGRSLSRQEPPKKYSASPEPKKCSPQPKSQRKSSDESANDARETSLTREEHSGVEIDGTSIEKTQKGVEPSDAPKRKEQSGPVESLESSIVEAQTPSDQLNDTKSDNISSKRQSSNTVEEHYLKNANVEEPNRRVDLKSQAESGDHKKTFLSSTERKKDAPSSKVAAKIKSFVASNAVAEKERKESAKKSVFKPSRDFSQRKPIRISAIKKESLTSKLKKTDAVPVREIKPRRNSLNDFDDLPDTTLDIPLTASDEEIKPPAQGILNEDVKKKKRKKDKKKKDKKKKHQRKSSQSEEDNVPSAIERHIVIGGKSSKRKLAVSVPNDNASSKRSKNIPNDLEDARHRITSLRTQSRKSSVEEVKSKSAVWRRVKLS